VTADGGFNHMNFSKKATLKAAPKKAATKKQAFFDSDDDFSAPVSKPAPVAQPVQQQYDQYDYNQPQYDQP
jgi:hypothetical protein